MKGQKWTLAESNVLRAEWGTTPAVVLAERLSRPLAGVYFQAHKLGLRPKTGYRPKGLILDPSSLQLAPSHYAVDAYSFARLCEVLRRTSAPPSQPDGPQNLPLDSHCPDQTAEGAEALDMPV